MDEFVERPFGFGDRDKFLPVSVSQSQSPDVGNPRAGGLVVPSLEAGGPHIGQFFPAAECKGWDTDR